MERLIWISLVAPAEDELRRTAENHGVPLDYLKAALDEEEQSRLECEIPGLPLILVHVPITEPTPAGDRFNTIPFGIVVSGSVVITVCLQPNPLLEDLEKLAPTLAGDGGEGAGMSVTRFVFHILYRVSALYLHFLRRIDRQTDAIEKRLHESMRNEELMKLLNIQKGLVYFFTSLKSNDLVIERLHRARPLPLTPDDEDLLEDAIIENRQALEMNETYNGILSSMMEFFASIISNNLNIVMKFLSSITIVLALPAIVGAFYGMNVALPGQGHPAAFWMVMGVTVLLSGSAAFYLYKKNMF